MARHRAWAVKIDPYPEVTTNDLTLDEAAIAEQVSGVPWSIMNPLASAKVAKALLVLLMVRAGEPEDAAITRAGTTSLEALHGAFRFVPGDEDRPGMAPREDDEQGPPSSAPTSAAG